jgi:hypothetical protein
MPGVAAYKCPDGSWGGNTGRCLTQSNGTCAWEMRDCPAGTDAGPVPDCFDNNGVLLDAYKSCNTAADCVAIDYTHDCCGSHFDTGASKSQEATVQQCIKQRFGNLPQCACPAYLPLADDKTTDDFSGAKAAVTCHNNKCETTFKPTTCGTGICTATEHCCGGGQGPVCLDATTGCPISQRKMKKDITYLSETEKERLSSDLMSFPLATYRYKTEGEDQKTHLGFIIDDVAPSPAVLQSGERVDLYGYSTMTVAALQVQAKEIAELKKQVDELKRDCVKKPAAKK